MARSYYTPSAIFDTLKDVVEQHKSLCDADEPKKVIRAWLQHCFKGANVTLPRFAVKDYQVVINFLCSYQGSSQTFNAYRRELERLTQWAWFIQEKSLLTLKRDDLEAFIRFCIKPHKRWIGLKTVARFKKHEGLKVPNPVWRPFEARLSKKSTKAGQQPIKDDYAFSQQSLQALFAIIGSFYQYLLQEEITTVNPVALIRQKSKFLRHEAPSQKTIRRLSVKQWQTVIGLAKEKAKEEPKEERTVFILSCLYGMYLRISELATTERWAPTLSDFHRDNHGHWWFKTVGKGNKTREIAVSPAMLAALKRYRTDYLGLSALPQPDEKIPLLGHANNPLRPMRDERPIRHTVQVCFDAAADVLKKQDPEEAEALYSATVHWLRHTGISDDVKHRPREHVRDDAGHSSSAITDRYIDVELRERASSASDKEI